MPPHPVILNGQLGRVYDALQDGEWHTLADLADRAGAPEASVSTRLRDLRLPQYGRHDIASHRRPDGVFEYRLLGVPHATSDRGREYLELANTCGRYQRAAEALRTALTAMQSAGADPSLIAGVRIVRAAMWEKREQFYARYIALAPDITPEDLSEPNARERGDAEPGTIDR